MADVKLVDLDVFKRYSLAIRQETAPVDEILAVLDATRLQVEAAGRSTGRIGRRRRNASSGEAADPTDPAVGPADEDFAP